jgi:hypothetical protein
MRGQTDWKKSHPSKRNPIRVGAVSPVIKPQQHQTFLARQRCWRHRTTFWPVARSAGGIGRRRAGLISCGHWIERFQVRKVVARSRGLDCALDTGSAETFLPACTDALPLRQRDRSETIPVRHGSCPRASVLMKNVVCRYNSRGCWEKVRTQNHSRDMVLADVREAVGHPVAAGRSLRRGVEMAACRRDLTPGSSLAGSTPH